MRLLLKKDLTRDVWKLAGPVVLGMISQTLMNVVDTAMVGRLGAVSLAATGMGGMLSWMVLGTFGALNIGVQAITARRFGEGERTEAGRILDNGLVIGFILGSVCTLFISLGMKYLFQFFTNDPAVVAAGSGYIYFRLLSGLPFLLITVHRGFFNGIGRTKLHMRVVILNNVMNVVFNYLLIFGKFGFPRMEAHGAGLGTTLANIIGCTYFFYIALSSRRRKPFKYYRFVNIEFKVIRGILKLTIPSGLQVFLTMIGFSAFSAIVARIGTIELAATNVCITIMSLSFLPGAGLGIAAASLIGQKLGEQRPDLAQEFGWESARVGILAMGGIGLFFIILPSQILQIFSNDMAVISAGILPLRIIGFVQAFDATGMILSQALQGAGLNRWVLKAEVLVNLGFFIPGTLAAVFLLDWGLIGAWVMMGAYFIIFGFMVTYKFAGGKWTTVKV